MIHLHFSNFLLLLVSFTRRFHPQAIGGSVATAAAFCRILWETNSDFDRCCYAACWLCAVQVGVARVIYHPDRDSQLVGEAVFEETCDSSLVSFVREVSIQN